MRKEGRLVIGAALFIAVLLTMSTAAHAGDVWMRVTPAVDCKKVTITPSTVLEGYSVIRVTGSGCIAPLTGPATVIVWTPFGHSLFGLEAPSGGLLSGGVALKNGNFTTVMANYGAYPGEWDVYVQIFQSGQLVSEGSGGVLTVMKALK